MYIHIYMYNNVYIYCISTVCFFAHQNLPAAAIGAARPGAGGGGGGGLAMWQVNQWQLEKMDGMYSWVILILYPFRY